MIEESLNAPLLPTQQIIQMIEEFVDCLNYPKTQAMLAQQKQNKNLDIKAQQRQISNQVNQIISTNQIQHKKQENQSKMQEQNYSNEQNQVKPLDLNNTQMVDEPKKQQAEEKKQVSTNNKQQFAWKHEQAKFYSKFATFSQIIYCLQTSATQRQIAHSKLVENSKVTPKDEIVKSNIKQVPSLLHIFSAFDTISKVKKFTVPIYRNFSLQPKFSKYPKFLQASPKQHYAIIIDDQSTIFLIHLKDKCLLQFQKAQEGEQITSLKWLNGGTIFATGMASGKLNLMTVSRDKQFNKLTTLHPHLNQVTAIHCSKDYLYTCSSDYTIARIYIRLWKIQRQTKLKGDFLTKMVKIDHKKLKDIIFGIERNSSQLIMIDEVTGLSTPIFSIRKEHLEECRKLAEKKQQKIQSQDIIKNCWIEDVITNHDNNTLIIAVAGINPSVYQIDPLRNQTLVRLNHSKLKQPFFPLLVETSKKRQQSNIYITLSHKSQILAITTNSNNIFYVRIKNWRTLHEYTQTIKSVKFGKVTATKRNPQNQQSMIQTQSPQSQQNFQKQCIICIHNNENNNIEVYENFKTDLKVIRSDIARTRAFLATGAVFPTSTQGFLQLLQTIRQNYQALV